MGIMDGSDVCQIFWNRLIWVSVVCIKVNWVGIFVIPNNNFFAPNFFSFKNIFALIIFELFLPLRFSLSLFIWHATLSSCRKIQHPDSQVKDVAIVFSIRLCDHGNDWSLWVHPSAVMNIPTRSGNMNTTIKAPEGEAAPIIVSWSSCLLEVGGGCLNSGVRPIFYVSPEWVCNNHQVFYSPSYFGSRQQDLNRLFRTPHLIINDTVLKCSIHH